MHEADVMIARLKDLKIDLLGYRGVVEAIGIDGQ